MDEFGPHRESCQLQQLRNDQIWQNAANAANGNYNLDFLQSNVRKWTTAMARQRDNMHAAWNAPGMATLQLQQCSLLGERNYSSVETDIER